MKTIYNVYVEIESQEQADRMKRLCIDNGLPIWDDEIAFEILDENEIFGYSESSREFFIIDGDNKKYKTKVTEQEFINLLKETK